MIRKALGERECLIKKETIFEVEGLLLVCYKAFKFFFFLSNGMFSRRLVVVIFLNLSFL